MPRLPAFRSARVAERRAPDTLEVALTAVLVATVVIGFLAALGSNAPATLHGLAVALAGR
ncbi:hypothetical protein [Roseicella aquatilis]|uniref:Uncharacterized protein n=1 Tax=Roseicella aquatilis TaxID=2527868 RepID=A0A4R4DC96_9PROT|nr:hypothetical protein [Roseicella aquatilis]TCZ57854.1 hypothetical protein EXY23_18010 [Roseicella aquatilis]